MTQNNGWVILVCLFALALISGCGSSGIPVDENASSDSGLNRQELGGREVLGYYTLTIDPSSESVVIEPTRSVSLDKQYLSQDEFTFTTAYKGFKENQLCYDDWISGDITFQIKLTNDSEQDCYDVWLVVLDGHEGELLDPSSWVSTSTFDARLPYIAFVVGDERCLPAGGSDSRIHVWRNPCEHPFIDVDVALVGTFGHPSETPADISPDPATIEAPIWDIPGTLNFRAWVADHQKDSSVTVVSNDIGIPPKFKMFDDGLHGDGSATDGLYATGDLAVTGLPCGIHEIWIRAISPGDGINVYNKVELIVGYVDASWDEPVSLKESGYLNQLGYCDLAMDSTGRLHFAWMERLDWGGVYVFFCWYRSFKDGSLSDPVNLNQSLLIDGGAMPYLSNPQLVVGPNDEVYVIWHQWNPNRNNKLVMYSRVLLNGIWSPPYRIDGEQEYQIYCPHAVCKPDGDIVLVSKDYRNSTYGVCATSVQAGSNIWPPTTRVYISSTGDSFNLESMESLQVGVDGFLYLALTNRDSAASDSIRVLKINPSGFDASIPVQVNDPTGPIGRKSYPCVWVDPGGSIGVAWSGVKETGLDKRIIWYSISDDDGETWGTGRILYDRSRFSEIVPVVKAYGEGQWCFVFNHNHRNFCILTFDAGESFSELELLPNYGSTNLPNFIVGEGFDTWHVWRSNHIDTDYNTFLSRRYYK